MEKGKRVWRHFTIYIIISNNFLINLLHFFMEAQLEICTYGMTLHKSHIKFLHNSYRNLVFSSKFVLFSILGTENVEKISTLGITKGTFIGKVELGNSDHPIV